MAFQVNAAMLLGRAGNAAKLGEVQAGVACDSRHHAVERIGPHQGRRDDLQRLGAANHAAGGAILRKVAVETQRVFKDNAPAVAVNLDDDRAEALRAAVKSEI